MVGHKKGLVGQALNVARREWVQYEVSLITKVGA
jgi:hypothetical protein